MSQLAVPVTLNDVPPAIAEMLNDEECWEFNNPVAGGGDTQEVRRRRDSAGGCYNNNIIIIYFI